MLFALSYLYVCVHNFLQDCGQVNGCGLKVPPQSNSLFDCSKAWLSDLDKIDLWFQLNNYCIQRSEKNILKNRESNNQSGKKFKLIAFLPQQQCFSATVEDLIVSVQ